MNKKNYWKHWLVMPLFIISTMTVFSQYSGTVRGKVVTIDGVPIPYAKVTIEQLNREVITAKDGSYQIDALPAANYILKAFSGIQAQEKTITIADGNTETVDFTMTETDDVLDEIIVNGRRNKFADSVSEYVAKTPLKNLENAQVYNTINRKLLKELVLTDFSEALRNVPGVYKARANRMINTSGGTAYALRGFGAEASMVNGIPSQTNGEYELANIERIEVLKGPSAALYGGVLTAFGGLINIITKRPLDYSGGEVAFTTGSYGLYRSTADLYGPLNKAKTFLYRLNTAYTYQGSFQDAGFRRSFYIAPSVQYKAQKDLTINIDAELYSAEATNPSSIFLTRTRKLFVGTNPTALNFDWRRSYTSNDVTMKTPTVNARALVQYDFSDKWKSQTIIATNTRKTEGIYQYQFMRSNYADDSLQRTFSWQNTSNTNLDVQQNFTGAFRIGRLRNRVVAGIDFLRQTFNNDNSAYIVYDTVVASANNTGPDKQLFTHKLREKLPIDRGLNNHNAVNLYSVYVSDVINVTDQFLISAGVRIDRYKGFGTKNNLTHRVDDNTRYQQTAVSPKFGIVYQLLKDRVSLFANYMNGFSYLAPVNQPLPGYSGILKPQHANQSEGGVKVNILNNRLSVTASYYNIAVSNMTRTEPIERGGQSYPVIVQDGIQKSKGVEIEVITNPVSGLNIIAGYGYNDSKLMKADRNVEGLRPSSAGPAHLANAWVSYKSTVGNLKGIGVGFGGNYMGEYYTTNTVVTGSFILPDYVLLNTSVFYDMSRFSVWLKLNNLTNRLYFTGQGVLNAQMPRNITGMVSVRF